MSFSTEWSVNRNKALASAGEAIIEARKRLDQLAEIHRKSTFGELPDLGEVVHISHALQEAKDRILVGIVESSSLPKVLREGTWDWFKEAK